MTGSDLKKLLFLYNPHAGKGRIEARLGEAVSAFQRAGYLVTLYATTGAGDATRAVRALAGDFDRVICCGGDGTLSETVEGLLPLTDPPVLGYVPAGTTNDFSRSLHIPAGLTRAAALAADGEPAPCDIGSFNDRHFVYVAAFGAFTSAAYDTPQSAKNFFGHAAYVLAGFKSLGEIPSYRLTVSADGHTIQGDFIFGMISNSVSVGGFEGVPNQPVNLHDGKFEIVLVRTPQTMPELSTVITALSLLNRQPDELVLSMQAKRLSIRADRSISWTLDGEFGGETAEAEIEALQDALLIVQGEGKA